MRKGKKEGKEKKLPTPGFWIKRSSGELCSNLEV
jgi:hypothetical protein